MSCATARKDWWPSLDAIFQPSTTYPAQFFLPANSWRLLLQANVPIFDSGQRAGAKQLTAGRRRGATRHADRRRHPGQCRSARGARGDRERRARPRQRAGVGGSGGAGRADHQRQLPRRRRDQHRGDRRRADGARCRVRGRRGRGQSAPRAPRAPDRVGPLSAIAVMTDQEAAVAARLRELGIEFTRHEHPPVATVEEAKAHWAGIDATHCKNLFLRNQKGSRHYLVVLTASKRADLQGGRRSDRRRQAELRVAGAADDPSRPDAGLGVALRPDQRSDARGPRRARPRFSDRQRAWRFIRTSTRAPSRSPRPTSRGSSTPAATPFST